MPQVSDREKLLSLVRFNEVFLTLSKLPSIDSGDIQKAFQDILENSASALKVERASIWLYNEDRSSIICSDLYQALINDHSSGMELKSSDFPDYFQYLKEERTLSAYDAHTDNATHEFSEVYLKPLNIYSMLDAPIRINGVTVGVICFEKVSSPKRWTLVEESFAGNISDLVARTIQAGERIKAQKDLEMVNIHLNELVIARTQELERQRAKALYAAKMATLGEMAGGVAHKINNPLAIIGLASSHLSLLLCEPKEAIDLEACNQAISQIDLTVEKVSHIIKGLKFFSRDASVDTFEVKDINAILSNTFNFCKETLATKQIDFSLVTSKKEFFIYCRETEISQVVLNLITNAADAIDDLKEKWIKVVAEEVEGQIKITITDSGKGIKEEYREKIMTPFFTTKDLGKGVGLGLSISKQITEKHDGNLSLNVESPNTEFIITFPVARNVDFPAA